MTRQEHIEWCKKRALKYVDSGNITEAYSSMVSDLKKHPDTVNHPGSKLGIMLLMTGKLSSVDEMSKFINDFN